MFRNNDIQPVLHDSDEILIRGVLQGKRADLESLIARYQGWIYNVALKMTLSPPDAEDITQEILIKLITKLAGFDPQKAAFRTWLYRVAVNHFLNMKKRRYEEIFSQLDVHAGVVGEIPDTTSSGSPEALILIEELKIKCLTGLLLCLERKPRLVFIMSEIFDINNREGAAIMEVSAHNYRQLRSRSRRKVYNFIHYNCSLVRPENSCRCGRKIRHLIRQGFVDPDRLTFYAESLPSIAQVIGQNRSQLEKVYCQEGAQDLFRNHPFYDSPPFEERLGKYFGADMRRLINS